jgi:hypothetical protein
MAHGAAIQQLSDEFLSQVGACITHWADIEEELFEICLACLGCTRERAAIVYYRTPTIDSRLNLVDELVETVLPKPERPSGGHHHPHLMRWRGIRVDFRRAIGVRNRIAHQPIEPRRQMVTGASYQETWFEISSAANEQYRKKSVTPLPPLRLKDLQTHYRTVMSLRQALRSFRAEVLPSHGVTSPPPASLPMPQ